MKSCGNDDDGQLPAIIPPSSLSPSSSSFVSSSFISCSNAIVDRLLAVRENDQSIFTSDTDASVSSLAVLVIVTSDVGGDAVVFVGVAVAFAVCFLACDFVGDFFVVVTDVDDDGGVGGISIAAMSFATFFTATDNDMLRHDGRRSSKRRKH